MIADLNGTLKEKRKVRFPHHDPVEAEDLPPLVYLDVERTIAEKYRGGCRVLVVGSKSTHKTELLIREIARRDRAPRRLVLFIATEGAHGIRKTRLKAARRARGMSDDMIRDHWRTVPEHFNLLSPTDRAELIEDYREFNPDIVVLDVLAKSVPGNFSASEVVTGIMPSSGGPSRRSFRRHHHNQHAPEPGQQRRQGVGFGVLRRLGLRRSGISSGRVKTRSGTGSIR